MTRSRLSRDPSSKSVFSNWYCSPNSVNSAPAISNPTRTGCSVARFVITMNTPWHACLAYLLVVGVNGSGKTTTIGKFAERLGREGRKVVIAAGDTFRAAAVAQLEIWASRAGAECIRGADGSDPGALAYQALERAQTIGADALLIDTAGRLHNKADLMAELQKLIRVLRKRDASAPHRILLVLDATTGQNAIQQVEIFKQLVEIDGLILTKLDGSARGGVLVAIAERFALPVVAVGVGESADDLAAFDPKQFADALLGVGT